MNLRIWEIKWGRSSSSPFWCDKEIENTINVLKGPRGHVMIRFCKQRSERINALHPAWGPHEGEPGAIYAHVLLSASVSLLIGTESPAGPFCRECCLPRAGPMELAAAKGLLLLLGEQFSADPSVLPDDLAVDADGMSWAIAVKVI